MRWERYVLEEGPDCELYTVDETHQELDEASPGIQLATQRTELASDRTLLAWVRTALFVMAAGIAFDIEARVLDEVRAVAGITWLQSAHLIGISLTAGITLLLAITASNYLKRVRILAVLAHRTPPLVTPAFVAAVLTVLLGLVVLAALTVTID